jgi:tRNA 2-thiouridine synthesizing protein A
VSGDETLPTETRPVPDLRLDAGEASCGELLILVFRAMKRLEAGQVLEVAGYDTGALEDIPAWCRLTRNPLLGIERTKPARFLIRKGG